MNKNTINLIFILLIKQEMIEVKSPETFSREVLLKNDQNNIRAEEEKKMFFSRKIDFSDPILCLDRSPVIVNPSTNLCKVHYLFIALGVSTIFVIDKGILKGVIKRNYFLGINSNKIYPS